MNRKEFVTIQAIKKEILNDDGSSDFCELYCKHPQVIKSQDVLDMKCRECPIETVIGLLETLNTKTEE